MKHPMTTAEEKRKKAGIPRETITEERIWNNGPDGLGIKMPVSEKTGAFVILEFKKMSDVTDQYVTRAKRIVVTQYDSIKSPLEQTLVRQGWLVSQRSFITGARLLNEQDPHENLDYFKVPQVDIESIRSKLVFKIFDEYINILKGMYSTRFNGCPKDSDLYDQTNSVPVGSMTLLITPLQV